MAGPAAAAASPPAARAWIAAARPKTLAASLAPVLLGTAFAWHHGSFLPIAALLALLGALLIQVGTNLVNDYYDHRRGADAVRVGPARASASGWIEPRRVRDAGIACFALAAIAGLGLVALAGWPILVVGLASLVAGYAYTAGPYPLAYHGWGDAFVFVFFGLAAVGGTYFVQAGTPPLEVLLAGAAPGAVATAILVVNNLRDRETDARVGKRTLAVRLGEIGTRVEYVVLLAAAHAVPLALAFLLREPLLLLGVATMPFAALLVHTIARARTPVAVARLLPRTSALLVLHSLAFSLGVVLA